MVIDLRGVDVAFFFGYYIKNSLTLFRKLLLLKLLNWQVNFWTNSMLGPMIQVVRHRWRRREGNVVERQVTIIVAAAVVIVFIGFLKIWLVVESECALRDFAGFAQYAF